MKKKKNPLRILIPLNIGLFCGVFFSILWEGLPIYLPLSLLALLLISVFLLVKNVEKVLHHYMENKDLPPLDLPLEENIENEISLKLSKANYILQKRILEILEENKLSKQEIHSIGEEIVQAVKASIKYERGNAKQIIDAISKQAPSKEEHAKIDLAPILSALADIATEIKSEKDTLQELSKKIEELAARPVSKPELISEPIPEVAPESISEPMPEPDTDEPFDPNKPMSPEDIAALIAATKANEPEPMPEPMPEPDADEPFDPNKPMSPEDIAALIAATKASEPEPTSEPANEPEPVATPELDADEPFDPNKPMSPEDIAALIASLGE